MTYRNETNKCKVCGGINGQHKDLVDNGPPWNPWGWVRNPCPNK